MPVSQWIAYPLHLSYLVFYPLNWLLNTASRGILRMLGGKESSHHEILTDSEIDILLASNSLKAGEVHLAHILVSVPEGASADQIQKSHDKAEDVKKQIDAGMDFTQAAIRFSNAPDALEGGDLGWRRFDEVPEAFASLAEGMQAMWRHAAAGELTADVEVLGLDDAVQAGQRQSQSPNRKLVVVP